MCGWRGGESRQRVADLRSSPFRTLFQFTFNPDWFKDEDGEDNADDEVDLDQYERATSENGEAGGEGEDGEDAEMGGEGEEETTPKEGGVEVEEKLQDLALSGEADGEEDGGKAVVG